MTGLTFDVYGSPRTEGSKKAYVAGGKARIVSADPKSRPWRLDVMTAARDAQPPGWEPMTGAVWVELVFWLPRPKSAPKTTDILPHRGLDVDKLTRSVFDAMTNAGVWVDDSQVVDLNSQKYYSVGPDLTRIYRSGFHRPAGVSVATGTIEGNAP